MEQVRAQRVCRALIIFCFLGLALCGLRPVLLKADSTVVAAPPAPEQLPAVGAVARPDLFEQANQARAQQDFTAAERLYREALVQQPGNNDVVIALAAVLSIQGKPAAAQALYESILQKNPQHLEALEGRARMLWWQDQPFGALKAYRAVLAVDPLHAAALKNSADLRQSVRPHALAVGKSVAEQEEGTTYTGTVRPFQEYRLSQRLTDWADLAIGYQTDLSARYYRNTEAHVDTLLREIRFDQAYVRTALFHRAHRLYASAAFSPSISALTGYGLAWQGNWAYGPFRLQNTLNGGYDYFYHWSAAGRDFGEDAVRIEYGRWNLEVLGRYALVRTGTVMSAGGMSDTLVEQKKNPHVFARGLLSFRLFDSPVVQLKAGHEYYDYQYHSLAYYTPHDRRVYSGGTDVRGRFRRLGYGAELHAGYDDGGRQLDNSRAPDGVFYRGGLECNYTLGPVTVGLGAAWFVNPRYQSQVYRVELSYN